MKTFFTLITECITENCEKFETNTHFENREKAIDRISWELKVRKKVLRERGFEIIGEKIDDVFNWIYIKKGKEVYALYTRIETNIMF